MTESPAFGRRLCATNKTNVETGKAVYVPARLADWLDYMKASCAIPFFYHNFCRIENAFYVGGGVADPLPVAQTHRIGARNIVVLRTNSVSHIKSTGVETRSGAKLFKKQSALQKAILNLAEVYNRSAEFIENSPANLTVHQIAPASELKTNMTTQNYQILMNDYNFGLNDGAKFLSECGNRI